MTNTFAQIIVDVPAMQTNHPYTYLVPEHLKSVLAAGMRVEVPFGHRQVLGIIVGISAQLPKDISASKLKAVTRALDLVPVLNTELLNLSQYLAETTFAFRISILKTILPNALKADYKHYIRLVDEVDNHIRTKIFKDLDEIPFNPQQFSDDELVILARLRRHNQIEMRIEVQDRAKIKTALAYQFSEDAELLENSLSELKQNAKKQQQLLSFIMGHLGETWSKHDLQQKLAIGDSVLKQALNKEWLTKVQVEQLRDPLKAMTIDHVEALTLNAEQQMAYEKICHQFDQQRYQPFLLEGITGSGKTEVYLQVAQHVLKNNKTVLFLVPEIALTPQMVRRVKGRFGHQTAILHSGLTDGERYDEWRRIERGEATVVVGARSAVFAPLSNIGLIIVDEEHETTYKQNDNPRYHAREVALWRGRYHQIPVILGSATPALETRARAQRGVYELLRLTQRAGGAQLPHVEVIDMKETLASGEETNFSDILREKLAQRLENNEQTVLMLNRRGFSSFVMCRDCGYVPRDPNCNLAMTLHMDSHSLKCHYCGHEEPIPHTCPQCGSKRIRYYGTGTEKVEKELLDLFPQARVIRMDQDTTRKKGSMDRMLQQFGRHEADILLGTQMIAKGLDFPDVTLVGVLNADTALGLPDFHASERTFQLLTQVSGRAGRAQKQGEVVVQSFNPQHYAIQLAKNHDYPGFYQREMAVRHAGRYSPYYFIAQIQASHQDENQASIQLTKVAQWLKKHLQQQAVILGPTPKPIAKMRNRYYFQIILKYKDQQLVDNLLHVLQDNAQKVTKKGLQLSIDKEPISFM